MSVFVTVARPFAKAAFVFAVEHQSVDLCRVLLEFAAGVAVLVGVAGGVCGAVAGGRRGGAGVGVGG
ncbi:hypothetical protein L2E17_25095, partial [Salmonella enterica subsp. enterica serovar Weltevreden]|nr:hypothetical protein [Salmonella enterica subsp. enterica serovar Weltevreden]